MAAEEAEVEKGHWRVRWHGQRSCWYEKDVARARVCLTSPPP